MIFLAIVIPLALIFTPVFKNFGNFKKLVIFLIGVPITLFAVAAIQVAMQSPEQEKAQTDAESARIMNECGATKEQMEQWFKTHKGWAEHTEEVGKCIRNHQ